VTLSIKNTAGALYNDLRDYAALPRGGQIPRHTLSLCSVLTANSKTENNTILKLRREVTHVTSNCTTEQC